MTKIQAQLYGMLTQQGVLCRDLLVKKNIGGERKLSAKVHCRGSTGLVREVFRFPYVVFLYRSIMLETVYLLRKTKTGGKSCRSIIRPTPLLEGLCCNG